VAITPPSGNISVRLSIVDGVDGKNGISLRLELAILGILA
jgi:hypothetical protein